MGAPTIFMDQLDKQQTIGVSTGARISSHRLLLFGIHPESDEEFQGAWPRFPKIVAEQLMSG